MLKTSFSVSIIILSIQAAFSQNINPGYWRGTMNRDGSVMNISFEFKIQHTHSQGFYNSPSQKASGIPLDSLQNWRDSLSFQLMSEPVTFFKCKISKNIIDGQIIQEGFSNGKLTLKRSIKPVVSYSFSDTSYISGANKIACRIYFPNSKGKHPALAFIHGSGAEGMFANQYLAEYLASKGIVTLIQDKQGVGKSAGNWTKVDFDVLTNDYVNAAGFLKKFAQVNKSQIGIYGHSQGGTLAPLVASKSKNISFVIAAASVGDSVYKQDLYRVENNLKSNDFTQAETKEAMTYYALWLNMARTVMGFDKLDSLNKISKDKKWFEWVEAPPLNQWIWKYYLGTGNYNSLDYWKKISVPVLLVYGENDQIEDVKGYIKNIDSTLMINRRNKDVTELILPNAQHNLCIFPEKNDKFFWWYLSHGYEDLITSWILYRFKN